MSPIANEESLRAYPSFIRYWFSRVISTLANQMLMVALAWQMYDLTNSAWDLGLVGLLQFIPALIMTLPAGHFADRFHRGHIISLCILSQAVVAAVLWWGTAQAWVTRDLIFALSVVLGTARAFQMPAQQAIAPALVKESLLQKAIALSSSGMQVAIIGGPALGGIIYTAGATAVYGTCTALLMIGFALMLTVKYARKRTQQGMSWESVMAGIGFVWQHKILLGAISLDLFAVLLGGATALLPIFARDILHVGPEGLGVLRAAPAVGALAVSLALIRWPLRRKVGYKLLGSVGIFGIGMVGVLVRRNPLIMFMSIELMLNAVNLSFVALAKRLGDIGGQTTVFFVMVVAAAEVVVGLGIIVSIMRKRPGANVDDISALKG